MKSKKKEKPKSEDSQKPKTGELKELQETLEGVQKEKDELLAKLQRVSADYANYQKRAPKQIADTIGYEKERIIKTLLPVLDNFEHTLQNAHSAEDVDVLVKGIRIIYDQLLDVLKSHNVEQIEARGETFDPAMHEAMTHRAEPDTEDNTVLEEFQKGYKLNGRVIRPSKVIVNKLATEQKELQKEGESAEEKAAECQTADECEATDRE
ncbi:MAG: nucleotide exchange factor GrpE [Phycisphaerales bacterium]|nr:MAG: nucleotide exchange factor GrpE [Phycisphaerales bacterium]